jgi:outer membrane protein assembly factor BamA
MHKTIALTAAFSLLLLAESMPLIKSVTVPGSAPNVRLVTQVGQPYDAAVIGEDVHRLWRTGRFADIRVEAQPDVDGTRILFDLAPKLTHRLHKILIVPPAPDLHVKVPEGADVDAFRAFTVAREAERRLQALGFGGTRVTYEIKPVAGNQADLVLYVKAGDRLRTDVRLTGDTALPPAALRGVMKQIRAQRMLPSESDLARLRSLYLAQGYFDAKVHMDAVETGKRTLVTIRVRPGDGWKSGWMIAPQLGWRASGLAYGATQIQRRLLPILAGDGVLEPDLPVAVEGAAAGGVMVCEAPKPRMRALRTAASFSLRLPGR